MKSAVAIALQVYLVVMMAVVGCQRRASEGVREAAESPAAGCKEIDDTSNVPGESIASARSERVELHAVDSAPVAINSAVSNDVATAKVAAESPSGESTTVQAIANPEALSAEVELDVSKSADQPVGAGRGTHSRPDRPGMRRGFGRQGGHDMQSRRADMTTLHAMFAARDKIHRTVKLLADGAEAVTESDDKQIADLIREHVPAMEGRVVGNEPLPPMTFHPIFVELIRHAGDYTLDYEETETGVSVKYTSDDPYVVMLVQEHAQLVSRFIQNGMQEIHTPYVLPEIDNQ